jgi:hypothetical protein
VDKVNETQLDTLIYKEIFAKIQQLCLSFPEASERESHGAPTFFVKDKKSFVQYHINHHGDGRIALWCAAPSGVQHMHVEAWPAHYFIPAYVGHLGWLGVRLDRGLEWKEIHNVIHDAYLTRAPQKLKDRVKSSFNL